MTSALQGDQGYMHHVASSYASSMTGASAFDDALAAAAAAELRSPPPTDRQRTQMEEALAQLGTAEGGGGGTQQGRASFVGATSPSTSPAYTSGSPPDHAPRPASGGWRPMDADAERESRVAAIRAEFRAVAQSVGASLPDSGALHALVVRCHRLLEGAVGAQHWSHGGPLQSCCTANVRPGRAVHRMRCEG